MWPENVADIKFKIFIAMESVLRYFCYKYFFIRAGILETKNIDKTSE